jgi:hypothetical protein
MSTKKFAPQSLLAFHRSRFIIGACHSGAVFAEERKIRLSAKSATDFLLPSVAHADSLGICALAG